MFKQIARYPLHTALVLVCGTLALAAYTAHRLSIDERAACLVQQRGLPEQGQSVLVLRDFHALLTLPPSKSVLAQQRRELPGRELYHYRWLVKDMNEHLANLLSLSAQQPKSRTCGF